MTGASVDAAEDEALLGRDGSVSESPRRSRLLSHAAAGSPAADGGEKGGDEEVR